MRNSQLKTQKRNEINTYCEQSPFNGLSLTRTLFGNALSGSNWKGTVACQKVRLARVLARHQGSQPSGPLSAD